MTCVFIVRPSRTRGYSDLCGERDGERAVYGPVWFRMNTVSIRLERRRLSPTIFATFTVFMTTDVVHGFRSPMNVGLKPPQTQNDKVCAAREH